MLTVIGIVAIVLIAFGGVSLLRGADAPVAGTAAPVFTLNSQEQKPVSLLEQRGKWVVLYFYPKDFTSGCTVEAHNFQRDLAEYEKRGTVILGVSMQDEKSHQDFCTKEGLNFKLLADTFISAHVHYRSSGCNSQGVAERGRKSAQHRNPFGLG